MITDGKKWHYLAVKNLSALFREITSNHVGECYCLNCLHSFRTENKLKRHKNVCKSHEYCYIFLQWLKKITVYQKITTKKTMKIPFIIYADTESLLEKMDTHHSNPEKLSTTKINKHTACCFSLFTYCSFDATQNKHDNYRGEDYMKNFSRDLKKHAAEIINHKKWK